MSCEEEKRTYNMQKVKMNHVARKKPTAGSSWPFDAYASRTPDPGMKIVAYASQKPPYDENAIRRKYIVSQK